MTPVDKAMEMLEQYKAEPKRETLCEALHILEKYLDMVVSTTRGGRGNEEHEYACKRCGVAITGRNNRKKYCADCRREIRNELQKRARDRRKA